MLPQKIFKWLLGSVFFSAAICCQNISADTCPDMSGTNVVPNGWYNMGPGKPLSSGNQFQGAAWTGMGMSCTYNRFPSTFVLTAYDSSLIPLIPGSIWMKLNNNLPCNPQVDPYCRCPSSNYASCPFGDPVPPGKTSAK